MNSDVRRLRRPNFYRKAHSYLQYPRYTFDLQQPDRSGRSFLRILRISCIALLVSVRAVPAEAQTTPWHLDSATQTVRPVSIAVYPPDPDTIYVLCDSIIRSTDRGVTWETIQGLAWGTDGGDLEIDPTNSKILYLSKISHVRLNSHEHWMSTDGGYNWTWLIVDVGGRAVSTIRIDPDDPKTVYVGFGPAGFLRTTNSGQSWDTLITPDFFPSSLAIAPSNDSILYSSYLSGSAYKSTDKGATWTLMPFIPLNPSQTGADLLVDPRDANIVYAGVIATDTSEPGGFYKSTDGGLTWYEKNVGIGKESREESTIRMNPRNPNDIFMGVGSTDSTGRMLFRTTNDGESWFTFSSGFPIGGGGVPTIAFDTLHDRIFAGVHTWPNDAGVYIIDSLGTTTAVQEYSLNIPREILLTQNYPNPFNPTTTIRYQVSVAGFVTLRIYNILGEEIITLAHTQQRPGTYEVRWNASQYPSGSYIYELRADDVIQTKKMVLTK